jgi:hypothetical protein
MIWHGNGRHFEGGDYDAISKEVTMKTGTTTMRTIACAFLAVANVGASASVYAQTMGSFWDSSQLPESRGRVRQFTLTPRGDVDGLILADGTEVKLPPHLSAQVVYSIRPGDEVQSVASAREPLRWLTRPRSPMSRQEEASLTMGRPAVRTAVECSKPSAVGSWQHCMASVAR